MTTEALDRLAALAGIEEGWWDFFGQWRPVPAETKRACLSAMGFVVTTIEAIEASLAELDSRPWRRWLEPVSVLEQGDPQGGVTVTLPAERDKQRFDWTLEEEQGQVHSGSFQVDTLSWLEERWFDGILVKRWRLVLPGQLALGYHTLAIRAADGSAASQRVIMAPKAGFVPDVLAGDRRGWGVATQVYSLRSNRAWGVGTYGDLARLGEGIAARGGATIGVNPLHALFPNQPDRFSPYSPSSRRFLNTHLIDPVGAPEFAESSEAQALVADSAFQAEARRLSALDLVDYVATAQLARPVLEALYRHFRAAHLGAMTERGQAFRQFQADGGRPAHAFVTFEALQEHFGARGTTYWRHWPGEYQHPNSRAVAEFAAQHHERVEFYWWLQFVADEQVGRAHQAARGAGAAIGLYRDLGVGIAGDGAEAWAEQENLAIGVSTGAPPDPLALKGQDWGLVPFNPLHLRESAYAPFIGVMAANMRHAGALRLDHAMALQRLYWVPDGTPADQGTYVRYPVDDLFRIVALESRRNACLVIGEDLGTVPEGFRERMASAAIFSYRVMVFEKEGDGFKRPESYQSSALAIFATHDLPSIRGWWRGVDIDKREALDLYPRPGMADEERRGRQADREALVRLLVEQGLLGQGFPAQAELDEARLVQLAEAIHGFVARVRSGLVMIQIEDVLGLDSQMNLPGTTTQHPNWRLRFPMEVEDFLSDNRLNTLAIQLEGRP